MAYHNEDDIADWISEAGITLRIDDVPPNDLGRSIAKGDNWVDIYAAQRYDATQLAQSGIIRDISSLFATRFLCVRRGNTFPDSLMAIYDEYMEFLKAVAAGTAIIPGISPKKMAAPVMVNTTWRLYPVPHGRVRKGTSTGKVTSYPQRVDGKDPATYGVLDYII